MKTGTLIALFFLFFPPILLAEPPFNDTTGIDIINETDPTTYVSSVYEGRGEREMFDARVPDEPLALNVFLFRATYSDGLSIEFRVNPEFETMEASSTEVEFYASTIGRLPFELRSNVEIVWISLGSEWYGIATKGVWINTGGRRGSFIDNGWLEEILAHEFSHVSLDTRYASDDDWFEAQEKDGKFISLYGKLHPAEDWTQSFLAYMALRYRPDRISEETANIIASTIPNRIAYFDNLYMNMAPFGEFGFLINAGLNDAWYNPATGGQGLLITVFPDIKEVFLAWFTFDTERPSPDAAARLGDPGHRWVTAQGPYRGATTNTTVYTTKGGVFDSALPPSTTDQAGDGIITIEFADCTEGLVTYEFTSLGISGEIPIQRTALDNVPLCEKLATSND